MFIFSVDDDGEDFVINLDNVFVFSKKDHESQIANETINCFAITFDAQRNSMDITYHTKELRDTAYNSILSAINAGDRYCTI